MLMGWLDIGLCAGSGVPPAQAIPPPGDDEIIPSKAFRAPATVHSPTLATSGAAIIAAAVAAYSGATVPSVGVAVSGAPALAPAAASYSGATVESPGLSVSGTAQLTPDKGTYSGAAVADPTLQGSSPGQIEAAAATYEGAIVFSPAVADAFVPTELAGLELWLDASDAASITESGGVASVWADKSGNGNDVSQGTGGSQPAVATVNDQPSLQFDGTDDLLRNNAVSIGTSPITMAIALTPLDLGAGFFFPFRLRDGFTGRFGITRDASSLTGFADAIAGTDLTLIAGSNLTVGKTMWLIVRLRNSGDGLSDFLDSEGNETSGSGPTTIDDLVDDINVGANANGAAAFDGHLHEIIVWNRFLSDQERTDAATYLSRWRSPDGIAPAVAAYSGATVPSPSLGGSGAGATSPDVAAYSGPAVAAPALAASGAAAVAPALAGYSGATVASPTVGAAGASIAPDIAAFAGATVASPAITGSGSAAIAVDAAAYAGATVTSPSVAESGAAAIVPAVAAYSGAAVANPTVAPGAAPLALDAAPYGGATVHAPSAAASGAATIAAALSPYSGISIASPSVAASGASPIALNAAAYSGATVASPTIAAAAGAGLQLEASGRVEFAASQGTGVAGASQGFDITVPAGLTDAILVFTIDWWANFTVAMSSVTIDTGTVAEVGTSLSCTSTRDGGYAGRVLAPSSGTRTVTATWGSSFGTGSSHLKTIAWWVYSGANQTTPINALFDWGFRTGDPITHSLTTTEDNCALILAAHDWNDPGNDQSTVAGFTRVADASEFSSAFSLDDAGAAGSESHDWNGVATGNITSIMFAIAPA